MRINVSDVQFEHYTPDPARGMGRTSKRFKAGDKERSHTAAAQLGSRKACRSSAQWMDVTERGWLSAGAIVMRLCSIGKCRRENNNNSVML